MMPARLSTALDEPTTAEARRGAPGLVNGEPAWSSSQPQGSESIEGIRLKRQIRNQFDVGDATEVHGSRRHSEKGLETCDRADTASSGNHGEHGFRRWSVLSRYPA